MMQCRYTDGKSDVDDVDKAQSSNLAETCSLGNSVAVARCQNTSSDDEPAVLPCSEEETFKIQNRTDVQQQTGFLKVANSEFQNALLECTADELQDFDKCIENELQQRATEDGLIGILPDGLNAVDTGTATLELSDEVVNDNLQQKTDSSRQDLINSDIIPSGIDNSDHVAQLQTLASNSGIVSTAQNELPDSNEDPDLNIRMDAENIHAESSSESHRFEQNCKTGDDDDQSKLENSVIVQSCDVYSELCLHSVPKQSLGSDANDEGCVNHEESTRPQVAVLGGVEQSASICICDTSDEKTELDSCGELVNNDDTPPAAELSPDQLALAYDVVVERYFLLQKKVEEQTTLNKKMQEDSSTLSVRLDSVIAERDGYLAKLNEFEELSLGDSEELKQLELTVEQQKQQILMLKDRLSSQESSHKQAMSALHSDLKSQIEQVRKKYEDCDRDKQSMVMKYAQAEQKNIELQDKMNKMDGWMKDWVRQRDNIMGRLNATAAEKQKLTQLLENKSSELASLKREVERQKELVSSHEMKAKWHQNKLKVELESHKETKSRIEELQQKLRESREECERIRQESQTTIKSYQMSQVMDSITKELQLKETEEELQNQRMEQTEQMEVLQKLKQELDSLKLKEKELLEELNTYKDKVRCLEAERVLQEETLAKFKETLQNQKKQNRDLIDQLAELETLKSDMTELRQQCCEAQNEAKELKQANEDLMADMDSYVNQESEHLKFSQRLSNETVLLQTENLALGDEIASLSNERESLKTSVSSLTVKCNKLEAELKSVLESKQLAVDGLEKRLNEATGCVKEQAKQLEERDDELRTLKRRHISNSKDLRRQLAQFQRRVEQFENKSTTGNSSTMSRSSSSGSLDSNAVAVNAKETHHKPRDNSCNISSISDIDKDVLIDKIIKLQKSNARKTEKIEFMQDHINQLLEEVKKKSRIIQNYIMREESYSLGPPDPAKLPKNVAAKRSGIVTSMFVSSETGRDVYEDLAEHNSRLQTVLEDKVIHNLTLKHTVETLGQEISHLSNENRMLQLELQHLRNQITHSSG